MGRLAYILAASHSGSTLLAMLLGSHPQACTVGELKADLGEGSDDYRCSCGERITQCSFWAAVELHMRHRGFDFSITRSATHLNRVASPYANRLLAPLHRGPRLEALRDVALQLSPAWRRHLPIFQQRNAALIECLQELTGAHVVIDSSKVALRLKYLLRNPRLDVHVIRLIRDGRAVALTYMDEWTFADATDPRLRGGGRGTGPTRPRRTMTEAAHEWRRSNEEAECLLRTLAPDRHLEVRYEALCRAPEDVLATITRFLGLDPQPLVDRFRQVPQHVIGNGMRLDHSRQIREDLRWRSELSPADLQAFDREAGTLGRRYHYT